MVAFGEGDLGYIETRPGRRRQLVWEDMKWAALMLLGEAPRNATTVEGAAVLWSMASRLDFAGDRNYQGLIQRYSQPINPRWLAEGDFCRPGGRNHGQDVCSITRTNRRAQIHATTWEDINEDIQRFVLRWARGEISNPIPRGVDFAVPAVAMRGGSLSAMGFEIVWDPQGRGPESRDRGGNCFYSNERSRAWEPERIKIVYDGRVATDSSIVAVESTTGRFIEPGATGRILSPTTPSTAVSLPVPENNILERIGSITSDRTEPPATEYGYFNLSSSVSDPSAADVLDAEQENALILNRYDRFYQQVNSLKRTSNLKMTQVMPVIEITTTDEDGRTVKLNDILFSTTPLEGYFLDLDSNSSNPERPIASLDQFQIHVEPTQYGATSMSTAELSIKVHNPELVTRDHPRGKYIAYMLSQGYNLRVKYGVVGSYDMEDNERQALQWKEEDFFVTNYRTSIKTDKTADITVMLMPNTQKLLNQIFIGENIPATDVSGLSSTDINDIVDAVVSGDRDAEPAQVEEIRRRLRTFTAQFNSGRESVGLRTVSYGSGTFGSILHGAISNTNILLNPEGITPIPVENMVQALQTIQAVLLTRRYQQILEDDCYRYTNNETSINAVNMGPLFWEVAKPELDLVLAYASQNNMEVGERFSLDGEERLHNSADSFDRRNQVKMVFGNFNSRAGQWADKPISSFPINMDSVFTIFRERRNVGEFSCKFNEFVQHAFNQCRETENFSVDTSTTSEVSARIEIPEIKYDIYKDPSDETFWIFYVYDNKIPITRFRNSIDVINSSVADGGRVTKDQVVDILNEQKIVYFEMGEEGSFLRELNADTVSDDTILSANTFNANRTSANLRDLDGSTMVPAGLSRDFIAGNQLGNNNTYRTTTSLLPLQVSIDAYIIPTALSFATIFIFFPIRSFSGMYIAQNLTHQITKGRVMTKMNLIANTSVFNSVPL